MPSSADIYDHSVAISIATWFIRQGKPYHCEPIPHDGIRISVKDEYAEELAGLLPAVRGWAVAFYRDSEHPDCHGPLTLHVVPGRFKQEAIEIAAEQRRRAHLNTDADLITDGSSEYFFEVQEIG